MRIALGISYDGAPFSGWQSQPSGATVQDRLEQALAQIAGEPVRIRGAGRTDTGVHALGQVAHFEAGASRPLQAWVRGTNAHLPEAIAVHWAVEVPGDFDARFSARSRRYCYLLYNEAVRPSVLANLSGWFHLPLDLDAMREASNALMGEHDFSAFRSSQCQAKTPVRTISEIALRRMGPYVLIDVVADAFLHHMVRNLVGSLVYVGSGRQPPGWLSEVLASRDRASAAPTFSPNGLYLAEIRYDSRWRLPRFPRIMPFLFPGALDNESPP